MTGFVAAHPVQFVIDTGADVTIVSYRIYEELHHTKEVKHFAGPDGSLKGLDGQRIEVLGTTTLQMSIGETTVRQHVWVARIKEDCILGADFLRKQDCVIDYPQNIYCIGNSNVPMQVDTDDIKCFRVVLERAVKIPGNTEMVISAKLETPPGEARCGTVGPTEIARRTKGIIVGRTLVDLRQKNIPVRVINLSSSRTKLSRGTEIAVCEPIACITPLAESPSKEQTITPKAQSVPDHLQDLYERSTNELNQEQATEVASLLKEYGDVFSKGPNDIGRAKGTTHKINTGDAQPIKQAPRRIPVKKRDEAARAVNEMEQQGIVEPSSSFWCAPVVLVRKKDGSTRFCVDYRKLNDVTRKDSFPLPRVGVTLDALNGAKWFSTLDLKSGYWQIELDSADKEKTAFSFGQGLWQFTVMPFGLCNAPATFERLMEAVLKGLSWDICLVYLDDIIVHTRSFDQHLMNLKCVLDRLRQANLKLNPAKCTLFQTAVTYLGYVVSERGVTADPVKVQAVMNWPRPSNTHEVRSYIGLCSYYRRFVHLDLPNWPSHFTP